MPPENTAPWKSIVPPESRARAKWTVLPEKRVFLKADGAVGKLCIPELDGAAGELRVVEVGCAAGMRPRPPVQKPAELPPPPPVGEVAVLEPLLDLLRVLVRRPAPFRIPLQARGVLDAELPGQVLHDLPRHRQRIIAQEPADVADGADLHRHAQPVRVRTPQRDRVTVVVIEEEEPLQLQARGRLGERPVRLLISQKLHRHEADRNQRQQPPGDLSTNLGRSRIPCASRR